MRSHGHEPGVLSDEMDETAQAEQRKLGRTQVQNASTGAVLHDRQDRNAEPATVEHDVEGAHSAARLARRNTDG